MDSPSLNKNNFLGGDIWNAYRPPPPYSHRSLQVPQVAVAYLSLSLSFPMVKLPMTTTNAMREKMIKKKQKIIKKIIMYRIFSFYSSINWSLHRKTAELVKCSLLEKVKFFCSEDGGVGLE